LNIRRFTDQATNIFKLIKSDIGRPFTDQVSDLNYPELAADAMEVLRTLVFIEKQIPSKDGRWFTIRIMPYRTFDDRIDGLVITFINMSSFKNVEVKLTESEEVQNLLLNSSSDIIIKLSNDLKILEFNPEAEKFFGKKRSDMINQNYLQLFIPEPLRKKTEKDLNRLMKKEMSGKVKMQVISTGGNSSVIEWSVNVLLPELNTPAGFLMINKKTY
jgi:two-component system CheB/CheR fusion protein